MILDIKLSQMTNRMASAKVPYVPGAIAEIYAAIDSIPFERVLLASRGEARARGSRDASSTGTALPAPRSPDP